MSTTANEIRELLDDDIMSHGFLAQCIEQADGGGAPLQDQLKNTLINLLSSGRVEIGFARLARPDYVEFVAWRGSVDDRVARAFKAVEVASDPDKEFAYWLCLQEKADRFEANPDSP